MRWPREIAVNDSNAIDRIYYSPQSQEMEVHFIQTNSSWRYLGVKPSTFARLMVAHSIGKVFNSIIRNHYPAIRVTPSIPPRVVTRGGGDERAYTAGGATTGGA